MRNFRINLINIALYLYFLIIDMKKNKKILLSIQMIFFVAGQIVLPIIAFFISGSGRYLYLQANISLAISLILQLVQLRYIDRPLNFLLEAQHNFIVPYSLLAVTLYLNYEFYSLFTLESGRLFSLISSSIKYGLSVMNFCLACTSQYYTLATYIVYQIAAIQWIFSGAYMTMFTIIIGDTVLDESENGLVQEYKDISLALLATVIGIGLVIIDSLKKAREEKQGKIAKSSDQAGLQIELIRA